MPYQIKKQEGEKPYCVVNTETGESKGCSVDRQTAAKHMAALYANEKKSLDEVSELVVKAAADFTAETGEAFTPEELDVKQWYGDESYSSYFYPYGAKSYAEVEAQREAFLKARKADELLQMFPSLARNILNSYEMDSDAKIKMVNDLASELGSRLEELSKAPVDSEDKAISERADVSEADKKRAVGEYGDVTYADEKNKKYPIDTPEHIRAAWNYINKAGNSAKYDSGEVSQIKSRIIAAWKKKIDKDGPPSAKKSLKTGIADLAEQFIEFIKSLAGEEDNEEKDESLMFFKEEGSDRIRWIARYSNNFLDRDNPPDIISTKSHRRFVEMVDQGVYPYPVIELWHQKEWQFGKADWVAFDDAGFALASGYVYPGYEAVAETLSQCKDVAMSHGMPKPSIVRDPADPRVIIEHQTVEISPLPESRAANELTSFFILGKDTEETAMAIPTDKKKALEKWGVSETLLNQLEALNAKDADAANTKGIESKETTPAATAADTVPAAQTATADAAGDSTSKGTPAPTDPPVPEDTPPTMKEIAEALAAVLSPMVETIKGLEEKVTGITERVAKAEKDAADTKERRSVEALTPLASLMAQFPTARAVGSDVTEVKDSDPLSGQKPKETLTTEPITGIQFIDSMLSQKK